MSQGAGGSSSLLLLAGLLSALGKLGMGMENWGCWSQNPDPRGWGVLGGSRPLGGGRGAGGHPHICFWDHHR